MDRLISEQKVLEVIDSLKANFTCYDWVTLDEVASHVKAIPSAEPCEDAISRQAVLKQLKGCLTGGEEEYNYVKLHIDSIPPVTPQQKMGHWYSDCRDDYFICNQCKAEFERFSQGGYELIDDYNYCPNCGADMRGEQDDNRN